MIIKKFDSKLFIYQLIFAVISFISILGQNNELRQLSLLNSEYRPKVSFNSEKNFTIFGVGNSLYYLDSLKLKEFTPKFPIREAQITYVKAFSLDNIWVFYENVPLDHHTQCYHYNGEKWDYIHLPQRDRLIFFHFLKENEFISVGNWGGLIYYDGKKATNLKNADYSIVTAFKVFSKDNFLIAVREGLNNNNCKVLHFDKGKIKTIIKYRNNITLLHFSKIDSGYIILDNGNIYHYSKGKESLFEKLNFNKKIRNGMDFEPLSFLPFDDGTNIYFSNKEGVWKYDFKKIIKICKDHNYITVLPFRQDSYLLVKLNQVFYYGKEKIGSSLEFMHPDFQSTKITKTGDIGSALYRNLNNNVQVYITSWEQENHFYEILPDVNKEVPLGLKSVIKKSKLLGYGDARLYGKKDDETKRLWDTGMFFNDIDNDGDADVVMTALSGNGKIYENEGDDIFTDVTEIYNFKLEGRTIKVIWNDLNNDGLIDIVIRQPKKPLFILLNKGNWNFEGNTKNINIPDTLTSLMPIFRDIDNDGDRDLFLYGAKSHIYYLENEAIRNEGDQINFVDKSYTSPELTKKFDFFPLDLEFGDYDNDGDLDLFLVNKVTPIKLFENNGKGVFKDISVREKITQSFLAYSANWGDFDQDGYQDIFLATVGKNYIFWNHNAKYFEIDSLSLLQNHIGLSVSSVVNDIDNDGDLDIVVTDSEFGFSQILRNTINNKNFIIFRFPFKYSIGTKVYLYKNNIFSQNNLVGFRELDLSQGFGSSGLPELHFGVDSNNTYAAIIKYTSGVEQKIYNLSSGNIYKQNIKENILSFPQKTELFVKSLIFNNRKRMFTINIFIFLIILTILSITAYKKYYWKTAYYLFLYSMVLLSYLLLNLITISLNNLWHFYLPIYGTLIASLVLFYIINKYRKLYYKGIHHFELFDLLRQFNHSSNGMKYIDHLILLTNNSQIGNSLWLKKIKTEIEYFNDESLPLLKRINLLYGRMHYKNDFSKNYFSVKKLVAQILSKSELNIRIITKIKRGLSELKKGLHDIKNSIDREFSTDLMKSLTRIVGKFSQYGKISIYNDINTEDILVIIREDDLLQVFGNIFQNAFESMNQIDRKHLDIIIDKKNTLNVNIVIRDYGKGLSKLKGEPWFDEHFSTKKSSGLGLFHSKKIVESFGGVIKLKRPIKGAGTEVIITLRIFNEKTNND